MVGGTNETVRHNFRLQLTTKEGKTIPLFELQGGSLRAVKRRAKVEQMCWGVAAAGAHRLELCRKCGKPHHRHGVDARRSARRSPPGDQRGCERPKDVARLGRV